MNEFSTSLVWTQFPPDSKHEAAGGWISIKSFSQTGSSKDLTSSLWVFSACQTLYFCQWFCRPACHWLHEFYSICKLDCHVTVFTSATLQVNAKTSSSKGNKRYTCTFIKCNFLLCYWTVQCDVSWHRLSSVGCHGPKKIIVFLCQLLSLLALFVPILSPHLSKTIQVIEGVKSLWTKIITGSGLATF